MGRWRADTQEDWDAYCKRQESIINQEQNGTLGDDGYVSQDGKRRGYRQGRDYDTANTPKSMSDPYYHPGGTPIIFKIAIWGVALLLVGIALSAVIRLVQLNFLGYCYC